MLNYVLWFLISVVKWLIIMKQPFLRSVLTQLPALLSIPMTRCCRCKQQWRRKPFWRKTKTKTFWMKLILFFLLSRRKPQKITAAKSYGMQPKITATPPTPNIRPNWKIWLRRVCEGSLVDAKLRKIVFKNDIFSFCVADFPKKVLETQVMTRCWHRLIKIGVTIDAALQLWPSGDFCGKDWWQHGLLKM